MNRAAEMAVPEAKPILVQAAKAVTADDAVRIVRGGDTSVTDYFAGKTRSPLTQKLLPIVTKATQRVALADKYNALAGRASKLGVIKDQDANVQRYVTGKALDGLFLMIGEEERKIQARSGGHRQRHLAQGLWRLVSASKATRQLEHQRRGQRAGDRVAPHAGHRGAAEAGDFECFAVLGDLDPGRRASQAAPRRRAG